MALMVIVGVIAIVAWLVAAVTGVQIARQMPKGQRLAGFYHLGRGRFARIEEAAGPDVIPLSRRYQLAFGVFIAAIAFMILLSVFSTGLRRADGEPLTSEGTP